MPVLFDYLIIGSGPSAVAEAMNIARTRKKILLVSNYFGGCLAMIGDQILQSYANELDLSGSPYCLRDYLQGMRVSPTGAEYAEYIRDTIARAPVEKIMASVNHIDRRNSVFICELVKDNCRFAISAKRVVPAIGIHPKPLESWMRNIHALTYFQSYNALCKGQFREFTGKDIVIFGGGNSAFQLATLAALISRSVTIMALRYVGMFPQETNDRFALRAPNQVAIE